MAEFPQVTSGYCVLTVCICLAATAAQWHQKGVPLAMNAVLAPNATMDSYRKGEYFTENSSGTDQDLEIMGSKMFLHGFACLPLSNQTAGIVHFGISVQAEAKTTHLLADIW